jgi:hypothetical protein
MALGGEGWREMARDIARRRKISMRTERANTDSAKTKTNPNPGTLRSVPGPAPENNCAHRESSCPQGNPGGSPHGWRAAHRTESSEINHSHAPTAKQEQFKNQRLSSKPDSRKRPGQLT